MGFYMISKSKKSYFSKLSKLYFISCFNIATLSKSSILSYLLLGICLVTPVHGAKWVEVDEGTDSGDTYLWPYFYSASRFVDVESIKKKDNYVTYRELINSRKAMSSNVLSLIVEKKSSCDGKRVLWQHFSIYSSAMGQGKPIMSLNPNESQEIEKESAGFISDAFACNSKE